LAIYYINGEIESTIMIEIQAIGLFHCRVGADVDEASTEVIQILQDELLEEYDPVRRVTKELLGELKGKDFVRQKSARIHQFTSEAESPRGAIGVSTKDLLSELRDGDNTEENLETLASWYLQTDYAQSGLLIVTTFISSGSHQVGIIKAPFVDDIYEPDDDMVLNELEEVIKGDLKKGILFPRITPDGTEIVEEACVYQSQSSSRYPKHWYEYLHLEPDKTSDEKLAEYFKDLDKNENELTSIESTEEFDDARKSVEPDLQNAKVKIEIGGKEVTIELGEVLSRDHVRLVETNSGYHLILSGERPRVKFYHNQEGKYVEVLSNLDDFDDIESIDE
jgi:hypothetical protein